MHPRTPGQDGFRKSLVLPLGLAAGIVILCGTGCSDKRVDTAKLQGAFQTAGPDIRADLDKAVLAINSSNYPEALPALRKVAFSVKLTPDQRLIVEDSITKVRARIK